MHVVVIGCGRVGSELAGALELAESLGVGRSTRTRRAFRRLPAQLQGPHGRRVRLRPRPPRRGRHRRGRRVRVGDERRQLEHPLRPHRARDVRDRARRRPHLRPAPRADLPTARHPDGRDRRRGRPIRCCAACCPDETRHDWIDATGKVGLVERPIPAAAVGRKLGALNEPGRFWLTAVSALRSGADRHERPGRPGGRRAHVRRARWTRSTSCRHTSTPEAITDAGRDRRCRQRRAVHRQRPRRHGPRRAAHRAEPEDVAERCHVAGRRARRRRRVRGDLAARGRPRDAATSSSPRPATTRTTS